MEELPPELYGKEEPPEDFFEILRLTISPLIPSPYMLQLFSQDWLLKRKGIINKNVSQFSVLGSTEFRYVGAHIQKDDSVIQFTGKNKKEVARWVGKQCIHAWEISDPDPEKGKEFRVIIDPVIMDLYSIFLSRQDWLIKEIHEAFTLTSIVTDDECASYYQFEAIPNEIFRKNYEITHDNVSANTPLSPLSQPKLLQRTRRRWDNPLIPNFEPTLVTS